MSSGTINFTTEHKARLAVLANDALFKDWTIKGLSGSETNIYDLIHNTSLNSLQTMHKNLKKLIEDTESVDEWSMTDYQQSKLSTLKRQRELINLVIGYKRSESIKEANNAKIKDLKGKAQEIKQSTMTPAEQLAAINAEIEALGGEGISQPEAVEDTAS